MPSFRAEDADVLLIRPNGEQVVLRPEQARKAPVIEADSWWVGPAHPGDRRRCRRLPEAIGRGLILDLLA